MPLTAAQLATDMDLVSASIEAADVTPATIVSNATLKTATMRLMAALNPYVRASGLGPVHQQATAEVYVAQNNTNAGG